jgi:hypothetical protein
MSHRFSFVCNLNSRCVVSDPGSDTTVVSDPGLVSYMY